MKLMVLRAYSGHALHMELWGTWETPSLLPTSKCDYFFHFCYMIAGIIEVCLATGPPVSMERLSRSAVTADTLRKRG